MAGANRRTTCALGTVAVIFIIVIIILCLVPDPCRRNDPRPECKRSRFLPYEGDITNHPKSTTETPSTTVKTTTPIMKPTDPTSTTSESRTWSPMTTTPSSTDSSLSSTEATEKSLIEDDANSTTSSTLTSTFVTEDESVTTSEPGISNTTDMFDSSDNETNTIYLTSTTYVFDIENTSDVSSIDYNATSYTTDIISTTLDLNETMNTTDMSTTETMETTYDTETSYELASEETNATETDMVTNATEISTTVTTTTTEVSTTVFIPKPKDPQPKVATVGSCNTTVCKEVSRRMLDILDPRDVDPCVDFYQYSCGGVLDDPFLKPENPQVFANIMIKEALNDGDRNDEEMKELFIMYDSCLNYSSVNQSERFAQVREVFEELEYAFNPMANSRYQKDHPHERSDFDLGKALVEMMKRHFTPFFDIIIDVSQDNNEDFSLKMVPPSFTSPFSNDRARAACYPAYKKSADEARKNGETFDVNEHYKVFVNCTKLGLGLQVRMEQMARSVDELQLLDFIEDVTIREEVKSEARNELDFMLGYIAKVMPSVPQIRKTLLNKDYVEYTLEQIQNEEPFGELPFDMVEFIGDLLGKTIDKPKDLKIQVYFQDVFKELFSIIYNTYDGQEPLMQNIMLLMWMEHVYDDLISPLGLEPGSPEYCFNAVTSLMDDYVSYLYLKELSKRDILQSTENQMVRMINITLDVMKSHVRDSGLQSRSDFLKKLTAMTGEVATLDGAMTALQNSKAENLLDVYENNFTGNYISLMKNYRQRLYYTYNQKASEDSSMWSVLQFPYRNTGVTSYGLNKFLIPHGAMLPPFYYDGAPSYVNYAGIGHMIAHELLHGFDSTGMKFNGENKSNMRSDRRLVDASECLAEKLSTPFYSNSTTGFQYIYQLNATLNLDELLADIMATNLAWDSYITDLTNQHSNSLTTSASEPPYRTSETIYSGLGTTPSILYDQALIHWGDQDILRAYFIKTAQNQCSSTSELDILSVMENEHLPPDLRVSLATKNNRLFKEAFHCEVESSPEITIPDETCLFSPMGYN